VCIYLDIIIKILYAVHMYEISVHDVYYND